MRASRCQERALTRDWECCKQETDGMLKKLAVAISALSLAAGALTLASPARAQGVKAGVLTCTLAGARRSDRILWRRHRRRHGWGRSRRQCPRGRLREHDLATAAEYRRQYRPQYRRRSCSANPDLPALRVTGSPFRDRGT